MKKACVVLGLLLLSASTAFAAPVPADPAFLASLSIGGACPASMPAADKDRGGSSVSCSDTGTCGEVDRNSLGERGFVPQGRPAVMCHEGHTLIWTDGCCDGISTRYVYVECINGTWVQYDEFCSGSCY